MVRLGETPNQTDLTIALVIEDFDFSIDHKIFRKTLLEFLMVEHPAAFGFVFHEIMLFFNAGFFILILNGFPASHIVGKIIFKNGVFVLDVCDGKVEDHEKRGLNCCIDVYGSGGVWVNNGLASIAI
jgi:hypothetical protein